VPINSECELTGFAQDDAGIDVKLADSQSPRNISSGAMPDAA